ncbi:MAG: PEGA domain-containing protein, partial [Planctomycetota bacterium]|nr:PEGA domain-containing protein [Planctomycetota bacterium]
SLSIKSKPSKAKVFLNGEDIGTLPKTLTDLNPGKYTVEVSLAEYEVWSERSYRRAARACITPAHHPSSPGDRLWFCFL